LAVVCRHHRAWPQAVRQHTRHMRSPHAIILLLVAVSACGGSGTGPTDGASLAGTFDLATIDGSGLPRLEAISASLDTLFTTGGELRVLSRGRISIVRRSRWHRRVGGPFPEHPDTVILTFRQRGSELLLDYPNTVLYGPYTDTALIDGDDVTVRTKIFGGAQCRYATTITVGASTQGGSRCQGTGLNAAPERLEPLVLRRNLLY
jgi:hypothetical protein